MSVRLMSRTYLARLFLLFLFRRVVVRGAVFQQHDSDEPDDAAQEDVGADHVRVLARKERLARPDPGGDVRRGTARDHRRELVAERCSAIAQATCEALGDE